MYDNGEMEAGVVLVTEEYVSSVLGGTVAYIVLKNVLEEEKWVYRQSVTFLGKH